MAPAYIDFAIKFLRNPNEALGPEKGSGTVSKDLANLMLGGVAIAYALLLAFKIPLSPTVGAIAARDSLYIPAAVLGIVVLVASVLHLTVGTFLRVVNRSTGSMEDTVNAALALSAVLIPWCSAVICTLSVLPSSLARWVGLPLVVSSGAMPVVYLPWAISATHPGTSYAQVYFWFTVVVGGAIVLLG